jgi:hypothetical protein
MPRKTLIADSHLADDLSLFVHYLVRSTSRSSLVLLGAPEMLDASELSHDVDIYYEIPECLIGQSTLLVADVIDGSQRSHAIMQRLKNAYEEGCLIVTTTREPSVQGLENPSSERNPGSRMPPNADLHCAILQHAGLPADFLARTRSDDSSGRESRVVTVHDPRLARARRATDSVQRPLLLVAMFNEVDIAEYIVRRALGQGCDVHVLDNWSTDGTFEILRRLAADPRVTYERFPSDEPSHRFELRSILKRKSDIAAEHVGRWIINGDADEVLCAPWSDVALDEALGIVQAYRANRIDFTMLSFCPVSESSFSPDLQRSFRHFEFGDHAGHYLLKRVWHQGPEPVDVATSGGHVAEFNGAIDFPYKFLLKHYPFRSSEHARRKIFRERRARYSPYERDVLGWHNHYDVYDEGSSFLRDPAELHDAGGGNLLYDFGLFVISDLAKRYFMTGRSPAHATS